MNSNQPDTHRQQLTPEAIAKLLTSATQQLDADTLSALRRARNVALERQLLKKPAFMLNTGHDTHWLMPHSTHQWVAAVILLVTILFGGINYWQHSQDHDLSHLDAEILTDDLPLEVFVD